MRKLECGAWIVADKNGTPYAVRTLRDDAAKVQSEWARDCPLSCPFHLVFVEYIVPDPKHVKPGAEPVVEPFPSQYVAVESLSCLS